MLSTKLLLIAVLFVATVLGSGLVYKLADEKISATVGEKYVNEKDNNSYFVLYENSTYLLHSNGKFFRQSGEFQKGTYVREGGYLFLKGQITFNDYTLTERDIYFFDVNGVIYVKN